MREPYAYEKDLLLIINKELALQSILYDVDLMPEQLEVGSGNWLHMIAVAQAFVAGASKGP